MSTSDPYSVPPQQMQTQPPKKNNTMLIVLVILGALSIPMLGCCIGLLLPAVQAAREAARRMSCSNNTKLIGLAMHNYHSVYKSLPPAFTTDAQGRPLHSWRTLLLPFMEQQNLYEQIDLTKPWDDPVNLAISETVVPQYSCPSMGEPSVLTTYVAVVDPNGLMAGSKQIRFRDAIDGLANTILFVETDESQAVPWMSPTDIDLNRFLSTNDPNRKTSHAGGAHVTMGDGAVIFVTDSMDPQLREALVTRNGGESVSSDF